MNFIIDQQLPAVLAEWLQHRGHVAQHVRTLSLSQVPDHQIWDVVEAGGSVMISRDRDFVRLALRSRLAKLVWVRCGNCDNHTLLSLFEVHWTQALRSLHSAERVIEIG